MHRVLKDETWRSFYGWHRIDLFMAAWKAAGFRPVGRLAFREPYASRSRFVG
jgi:adenine-specific DNA-methyltransferase